MSDKKQPGIPPMADYLAYDGYHVTFDVLCSNLAGIEAALLDAEEKAYAAGQEDWSDAFAHARDLVMDIMPGAPSKPGEAAKEDCPINVYFPLL